VPIRASHTPKASPPRIALLAFACASLGCIPSFPPCDCTKDEGGGGPADFPDFEFLDRSQECLPDVPLPEGADADAVCGYPEGPYGFSEGDVFENLQLFDCMGNMVQIAQYLPQEGFPDMDNRGVVFGIGAVWCEPCKVEGEGWAADFVDEYDPQGIQFIQALDEGAAGSSVQPDICAGWSASIVQDKFPILYAEGQGALRAKIEAVPNEPIPFTLIFDANANIIFRETGGVVDSGILEVQLDKLINDPYGN
jgi:hypothetical protein